MIYLLRHGEIRGASTKRFIGQTDVQLSQTGLRQAEYWRNYFSGIGIDRVFSSPLTRTVDTAVIVSGLAQSEITLMEGLQEIHLGQWDGKPFAEIQEKFPDQYQRRGEDLVGFRPPQGESFGDLSKRVFAAFAEISAESSANILIVAHAGVNRIILCNLLQKELKELFSIPQDYACLNSITNENKKLRVQKINCLGNSPDFTVLPVPE
jgi:alpha-ribazole phosphatase